MAVNYLNNRDVIRNILLSKASYTWYIDGDFRKSKFVDYDLIVCGSQEMYDEARTKYTIQRINTRRRELDLKKVYALDEKHITILTDEDLQDIDDKILLFEGELTDKIIEKARIGRYNRLRYLAGKKRNYNWEEIKDEVEAIPVEDLVLRVYTFEHIPLDEDRKKVKKKIADRYTDVNFQPYKHYSYFDGKLQCVAISHHDKDMNFSTRHGQINHGLASAFVILCRRYASRYNWRGYSYTNDMIGQAQLQLTMVGLQFNELFSANPFSYYTSAIKNAFTVIFNEEKKSQETRDRILMNNNQNPSWTKQLENELSRDEHWDKVLDNNNMEASDFNNDFDPDEFDDADSDVDDVDEVSFDDDVTELDETEQEIK